MRKEELKLKQKYLTLLIEKEAINVAVLKRKTGITSLASYENATIMESLGQGQLHPVDVGVDPLSGADPISDDYDQEQD